MLGGDVWGVNLYYLSTFLNFFFCCYIDGMVGGEVWLPWPKFFLSTGPRLFLSPDNNKRNIQQNDSLWDSTQSKQIASDLPKLGQVEWTSVIIEGLKNMTEQWGRYYCKV